MKKTLIALMALAGVAAAATITEDTSMYKGGDLYSAAFEYSFTLGETFAVTGDYDLLLAYYQINDGSNYTVNAFKLTSGGVLTLDRGKTLTLTDGALTDASTLGTVHNSSTFTAGGEAYTLTTPGTYTIQYLGGTNDHAAANLLLDGVTVATFTGGAHNMNGAGNGTELFNAGTIFYNVNAAVTAAPAVPEPTTATLSLLALAGLAARRRRK